jgi:predicted membrane metal-binding protein
LADPLMVSDVGAWLSFGATLGILVLAKHLVITFMSPDRSGWRRVVRPIVVLVAATLSAELVLAPIAAAVFGRVTLAGCCSI